MMLNYAGGPYVITEDLGKGRYRLQNEDGVVQKTAANCHRLKLWIDPNGGKQKPTQRKVNS